MVKNVKICPKGCSGIRFESLSSVSFYVQYIGITYVPVNISAFKGNMYKTKYPYVETEEEEEKSKS